MSLRSLFSALREKWSGRVPSRRRTAPLRRTHPTLEALEERVTPAAVVPPKIMSFTPGNGSTVGSTSTNPPLSITFNEAMDPVDVQNTSNYYLFNSEGQQIPINPGGAVYTASTHTVTLSYNNSAVLPADTYSLFVRGDTIHEATDTYTLANPGQIVTANTATSTVSTINTSTDPNTKLFNSLQSYPVTAPNGSVLTATPVGIAVGNFDADPNGYKDVAVVNAGTDELDIYSGTASGVFNFSPTLRIALPAGQNPVGLLSADFNFDGKPDLAVLDHNGNVDVFVNTSAAGTPSFTETTYAVGVNPTSFAAADLDGNGTLDIVVADPTPVSNGAAPPSFFYYAYYLSGTGAGTFAAAASIQIGQLGVAGTLQAPSLVAAGNLGLAVPAGDTVLAHGASFVLGGANGVQSWINQGQDSFAYTPTGIFGPTQPTALAVGQINQGGGGFGGNTEDVLAAFPTIARNAPTLHVYTPNGNNEFTVTLSAGEVVNNIITADVNGDNKQDVLFSTQNGPNVGTQGSDVGVLINTSTAGGGGNPGTVSLAPEVDYGVDTDPVGDLPSAGTFANGLAYGGTGGDHNPYIVTANSHINAQNQSISSFSVLRGTVFPGTNGTFIQAPALTDPNGKGTTAIAVGDVNGDGIPDLVVADETTNTISVYLGQQGGGYGAATTFSTVDGNGNGQGPISVVLADLNGAFTLDPNGNKIPILDVITANSGDNTVSVLIGNGDGTFQTAVTYKVGVSPTQVVAADFNPDAPGGGHVDLAVAHNGLGAQANARGVTILMGNGDGTFQPGTEILSNLSATAIVTADFFVDSTNSPDLAVADGVNGQVDLLRNDGFGNFSLVGAYQAAPQITALAAGDLLGNGFQDVVAVSGSNSTADQITTLLNNAGSGFRPAIYTSLPLDAPVNSVALTTLYPGNVSPYLDLVVGTVGGLAQGTPIVDNVFTLQANGDGTFQNPVPYEAGGEPSPAYVAIGSDPLIHVTSFYKGGDLVAPNLIANGNFESVDLSNERGNLDGWQTASTPNSNGGWYAQTGTVSPLSQTTVPALTPTGLNKYQAMLDQANLIPLAPVAPGVAPQNNPNDTNLDFQHNTYQGSNFLYQTFTVPNSFSPATSALQLSMNLYIDTSQGVVGFTNPNANPSLDYLTPGLNNYQVRIELLPATAANIAALQNGLPDQLSAPLGSPIFQSNPNTPLTNGVFDQTLTDNLTGVLGSMAGQQVILLIAGVTNRGLLIVGADNVSVTATYTENTQTSFPSDTGPQLRNLGFQTSPNGPPVTTDPTVIGTVNQSAVGAGGNADGGVNNVAYIAFDTSYATDPNFTGPNVFKTAFFDPNGNFQLTLPGLSYGLNTLGVRVVDKAGQATTSTFSFIYQGPSTSQWQSVGPGPISVASVPGLQYSSVTGTVTATATDPSDPSGNTYIVGAQDGGLWKTTNGGNSWTPLTDNLTDANGNPVTEAIGAVAYDKQNPKLVYAATGDGNLLGGAQGGGGVLYSTNGGASWTMSINSETVLAGARVTGMVASDPIIGGVQDHYVWVAVAAGGAFGPGVYRSTDGGLTWNIVMGVANMQGLAAGTTGIASATSIIVDPANSQDVIVGLGNIGLTTDPTAPATAGVWLSSSSNGNVTNWSREVGGLVPGVPNSTLPSGAGVGRVTVAEGLNVTTNIATYYVLIGTPTSATPETGGTVNFGNFSGLYKSKDGFDSFTKVMLNQANAAGAYGAIDLLANDAGNVGALAVDPTDPNVVYVGGSIQNYTDTNNPMAHGLIRVDTGDMRDTTYTDPTTGTIPNDGDDIQRVLYEENNAKPLDKEGVSWYDLAQNAVDPQVGANTGDRLPAYITSLSVDAQGRLIIGSEDGVWRAVYHGVGYDYSGGGAGELKVATPAGQVTITTINGNLQIAQLTSITIDPQNSSRFYTTEYETGSAVTNGGLNWNTSGLTGPANVNGGPDGDTVVVALPDPTDPTGTLATEYLLYAFNDAPAGAPTNFQPLASQDAGAFGSYVPLPTAGLPPLAAGEKAGYLPVLSLYDQKVPAINNKGQTVYFDELLLGTDKIYTTRTNSALWDAISPVLSPGNYITAATFAQSTDQTIYAATSDGKVWVTTNGGGSWANASTGLPAGGTITSIQVDATNPLEAFVTVNGGPAGSGHVFMTTNGGTSWTNISANLPVSAAYALAENPQIQAVDAAPNGRLYVGTSSGVYISTNFVNGVGTTWTKLGVGLPDVPVTSLDFSQSLEELVAGTNGRGGFVISTNFVGAHVVSVSPATPVNPLTTPLTSVTVTFNEPISSFPASQVNIVGAGGQTISVTSVTNVSVTLPGQANPSNVWKISFAPQSANGVYTISVGPNVIDAVGNAMDQNGNQINGENPGDVYTFNVVLNSTDDGNFVSGIYNNILGRPSDNVGFDNLLTMIDAARNNLLPGLADAYVVQLGAAQLVNDLYQSSGVTDSTTNVMSVLGVGDLLGRPANGTEQAYWASVLAGGGSFEQIIASIVADPSYFAQNTASQPINGNDVNFVTQVYEDLFNRAPTSYELNTLFVPQLQGAEAGARTADARTLLAGTAYQTEVITADYNTYLNRNPAPGATGDVPYWLNEFRAGVTQDQFVASLVASPEYYFNDAPALIGAPASIDTWVRAVYKQFFPGYTVSAGELSFWDSGISGGQFSLFQAALILDTSSLYRFGNLAANPSNPGALNGSVDVAYRSLLGRNATPQEIAIWEGVYANNPNFRIEDLDAAILGSGEYFSDNVTGNTPESSQNQQWANALYSADVIPGPNGTMTSLGSPNPSAEQTTDLPFLTVSDENARLAVSTAVVNSQEFHAKVTDFVYENYLKRLPTSYELNSVWLPVVGQGGAPGGLNGDEQLLAAVLSSPEYFTLQSDPTDAGLATDNSWLTSLYSSLRVPVNPGGEQANLNFLIGAYAPTRLTAIEILLTSPEYLGNFVTSEYNTLLGRAPSGSEVGFWIGALQAGATQEQLIASLISSPEFFNRAPNILGLGATPASNTTLVEAAYKVLFPNYSISGGELNFWLGRLGANYNQAAALSMAAALDTSSLYYFGASPATGGYVNGLINRTYVALLGRSATQFEINYWMANYTTTQNLIAAITDSEEYFLKTKTFP